jgi:hypothetical protein
MFAKLFLGNMDRGMYAPEGGQYTIDIGLKPEDVKKIKVWNRNYAPKTYPEAYSDGVDTSLEYYQFKRKNIVLNKKGEEISEWSGPPKLVDSENNEWDKGLVGNGSIVTLSTS